MTLGEGRHFDGIVDDESGLDVVALALLAEYLVDELAFAHGFIGFDVELAAHFAQLLFVHAGDVDAGVLIYCIDHRYALEGSLEAYSVVAYLDFGRAVDIEAYLFKHLFGEVHHPVVVLVGNVDFHTGELGVVGTVHAFVAEVL